MVNFVVRNGLLVNSKSCKVGPLWRRLTLTRGGGGRGTKIMQRASHDGDETIFPPPMICCIDAKHLSVLDNSAFADINILSIPAQYRHVVVYSKFTCSNGG